MMIDEITRLMRLLEFSDSAFPVGTFSFSNGLETAAFEGIVYDAQTLEQYTRTALRQTIYSDAIAALIAFRAAAGGNYKTILEADRQIILCKMNAEARLMLIRMGKKMAEICTQITDSPWMSRWLEDIRAERTPGTYPVAQAIYFQQNGSTEKDLFVAIEYGAINMILNAALRCVKVSHYETQAILYRLCTEAAENYKIVRELNFEDMQAFAPPPHSGAGTGTPAFPPGPLRALPAAYRQAVGNAGKNPPSEAGRPPRSAAQCAFRPNARRQGPAAFPPPHRLSARAGMLHTKTARPAAGTGARAPAIPASRLRCPCPARQGR